MIKSLERIDNRLRWVDQTRLPAVLEHKESDDYFEVIKAIKRLEIRGAPAIGIAAAYGVAVAVERAKVFDHGFIKRVGSEFKNARLEFKNAVQLDPGYVDAQLQLAKSEMKLGNARATYRAYLRVGEIAPENLEAQIMLIKFLILSQKREEASGKIDAILQSHPNNSDALLLSAAVWTVLGLRQAGPRRGRDALLWGGALLAGVAVAAPWGIAVLAAKGWPYINDLLHGEVVDRTHTATEINSGFPLYYLIRPIRILAQYGGTIARGQGNRRDSNRQRL